MNIITSTVQATSIILLQLQEIYSNMDQKGIDLPTEEW